MSDQEVEELKALVLSDRRKRRGPFSREVRERLAGYLRGKWQAGASLKRLGEELRLSGHTVQFWTARGDERVRALPKPRRVEVDRENTAKSKGELVTIMVHPARVSKVSVLMRPRRFGESSRNRGAARCECAGVPRAVRRSALRAFEQGRRKSKARLASVRGC
jgi:hypothetical protein